VPTHSGGERRGDGHRIDDDPADSSGLEMAPLRGRGKREGKDSPIEICFLFQPLPREGKKKKEPIDWTVK